MSNWFVRTAAALGVALIHETIMIAKGMPGVYASAFTVVIFMLFMIWFHQLWTE